MLRLPNHDTTTPPHLVHIPPYSKLQLGTLAGVVPSPWSVSHVVPAELGSLVNLAGCRASSARGVVLISSHTKLNSELGPILVWAFWQFDQIIRRFARLETAAALYDQTPCRRRFRAVDKLLRILPRCRWPFDFHGSRLANEIRPPCSQDLRPSPLHPPARAQIDRRPAAGRKLASGLCRLPWCRPADRTFFGSVLRRNFRPWSGGRSPITRRRGGPGRPDVQL